MAEKVLSIADSITVGELAEVLNLPVTTLIGELFKNGIAATINQRIDFETATIIVDELGLDVELQKKESNATGPERRTREVSDKATERPPIVAVMGHEQCRNAGSCDQAPQLCSELCPERGIHVGEGLVEEEHGRLAGEGAQELDLAALARRIGHDDKVMDTAGLVDPSALARLTSLSLLDRPSDTRLVATPQGRLVLNSIIAALVPDDDPQ